jgi:hypothetical protein
MPTISLTGQAGQLGLAIGRCSCTRSSPNTRPFHRDGSVDKEGNPMRREPRDPLVNSLLEFHPNR